MVNLFTKFHCQIKQFTRFIGKNVSIRGGQFAKLRNLKSYNLCSTQAIELKFSPDFTY